MRESARKKSGCVGACNQGRSFSVISRGTTKGKIGSLFGHCRMQSRSGSAGRGIRGGRVSVGGSGGKKIKKKGRCWPVRCVRFAGHRLGQPAEASFKGKKTEMGEKESGGSFRA